MAQPIPQLMNTREVARYLGINEKKVYALAKARRIPCTRVTGKWTFPQKLIDSWIEQTAVQPQTRDLRQEQRPFLLAAGSDDPSLGVLRELFEEQTKPASFFLTPSAAAAVWPPFVMASPISQPHISWIPPAASTI